MQINRRNIPYSTGLPMMDCRDSQRAHGECQTHQFHKYFASIVSQYLHTSQNNRLIGQFVAKPCGNRVEIFGKVEKKNRFIIIIIIIIIICFNYIHHSVLRRCGSSTQHPLQTRVSPCTRTLEVLVPCSVLCIAIFNFIK